MARTWDEKNNDLLKIERETAAFQAGREAGANEALQIAGATGQGGSPGQSYQRPLQNPDPGEAVFGVEKDGQTFFEFLKAMGIFFPVRVPKNDPNKGKAPFDDKGNDLSVPVRGHEGEWANKGMTIAHEGQHYNEHGQPISDPARGFRPDGSPVYLEHMEQTPGEHEYYEKLYKWKFEGGPEPRHPLMISQSPAALDALRKGLTPGLSSKQIRSLIKPFTKPDQFGHPTGSLRV